MTEDQKRQKETIEWHVEGFGRARELLTNMENTARLQKNAASFKPMKIDTKVDKESGRVNYSKLTIEIELHHSE